MKIELNWQKRAVILLAVSLIVLSIILAVFAIREAEREKLLKERDTAEEQLRILDTVAGGAEAALLDVEQRVDALFRLYGEDVTSERSVAAIREVVNSEALIDEIFVLNRTGHIVFPGAEPLYSLSGEENPGREVTSGSGMSVLWSQAETAEFQTRNYQEAVRLYRRLMQETSNSNMESLLLSRIGRCYGKAGNYRRAIETYETLLATGSPDLTSEGIPLAVIGRHQMISLLLESGKKSEAADALLDFRRDLFASIWPLSKNRFVYYRKYTDGLFETLCRDLIDEGTKSSFEVNWKKLQSGENAQLERMSILEILAERIVPQIVLQRNIRDNRQTEFTHVSASPDEGTFLVSFKNLDAEGTVALLLDSETLAVQLSSVDTSGIGLREGWSIRIVDDYGRSLTESGLSSPSPSALSPVVSRGFDDNFPPWTINLYRSNLDTAQRQFQLKRAIYILSVFIVIAALFLGGYLAIGSTAKELQLARLKSDFVSTVSHEFRTPLTSIRYLAELLQRGRVREDEKRQQYYETITGESERLSRLIENLLDFSKIESGAKKYQTEEADIGTLVADVASRFRQQAVMKDFALRTDIAVPLPKTRVDKEALSRALFNLLDNAVKYSGENPQIALSVRFDGENISFEVEDNGIGIGKSEQQKIFEKFYRSEKALAGHVKGSGIGLTMVDHIVKAHGGKVLLESEEDKGTKVIIVLPVEAPPSERSGDE